MRIIEFIFASSLITLMPGPDILFVAAQSALQGKRVGIAISLGLSSGLFVHTAAAALGLSLLLASSPYALTVIKYAGIAYLAYMGFASLRGRKNKVNAEQEIAAIPYSGWSLFRTGVTMNLLNPKVIIFFLAFFPQFIDPAAGTPKRDIFILGAIFAVIAVTIFTLVALCSDFISSKAGGKKESSETSAWIKASIYWLLAVAFFFY